MTAGGKADGYAPNCNHRAPRRIYDVAYLDVSDIGRNTQWHEIAKLLYVGLTRPRCAVVATGALPDRLYAPDAEPSEDDGDVGEPLAPRRTDLAPETLP